MKKSYLQLEDGSTFNGQCPIHQDGPFYGEVVFTTSMTGYVETLTDPSYCGQIVCFTYPLIGNYGVPDKKHWESRKIHAKGVIINELSNENSHHQSKQPLEEWLQQEGIPFMTRVDTRKLAQTLRNHGVMQGAICDKKLKNLNGIDPNASDLVLKVTTPEKKTYGSGKKKVIALDCGMKEAQIHCLLKHSLTIDRVPYTYNFLDEDFDGLFISNGPGNPALYKETIRLIQETMKRKKPIFGICLGMQLLALAAGAKTYKLPFGHRGQNQPCIEVKTKKCFITSQNHGYAVKDEMPKGWDVSYKNLNDGSVEGIKHQKKPFYAVQFHPEACTGPKDTEFLFEEFVKHL